MWTRVISAAMLVACTSTSQHAAPGPARQVDAEVAPSEPVVTAERVRSASPVQSGAVKAVTLRLRVPLASWPGALGWSPDGARLVVGDDRGAAQIQDARTGVLVHDLGQFPARVTAIAVSEARVAVAGSKDLRVWAAATGAIERELQLHEDLILDLRLAGEDLLAVDLRNALRRWDLRSGGAATIAVPTLHAISLAIAPNGGALALGGYGSVEIVAVPSGTRRFKLEMPNCSTAPDDLLCAAWREVEITEFPLEGGGTSSYKTRSPNWQVTDLAFSADGARLALGRADGVAVVIDAATGEAIARFAAGVDKHAAVALTAGGETLAIGDRDGAIAVWDLASRRELRVTHEPGQIVGSLAFSPDGAALAAGGPGQSVTIWDLQR